jgi:hypothetical protein
MTILSGSLSPEHGASWSCGLRRPPDTEGSRKYNGQADVNSQKEVIQFRVRQEANNSSL